MDQHSKEVTLIGIVIGLTLLACFALLRRSGATPLQSAGRAFTGILGGFMLLGGVAKFFQPFTTMFAQQIAWSALPFPALSAFAGQAGEIGSGLVLLAFFVLGPRMTGTLANKVFTLTHLLIAAIMLVAVYVHLHPAVPAEVLPFQSKPPVVTIVVLLLAVLNMVLRRRIQSNPSRS